MGHAFGAMARVPALFFRLELADAIVYKIKQLLLILILVFYLSMLGRELIDKKKSKIKINKSCCYFVDNGVSEF